MVPIEEAARCGPALALARGIAAAYGTELLLFGTAGTSSATVSREAEAIGAGLSDVRTLCSSEIAGRAIHRAVVDNGVDALVLGTKKRGPFQRLFPSTAERILDSDRLPVFVVPEGS